MYFVNVYKQIFHFFGQLQKSVDETIQDTPIYRLMLSK